MWYKLFFLTLFIDLYISDYDFAIPVLQFFCFACHCFFDKFLLKYFSTFVFTITRVNLITSNRYFQKVEYSFYVAEKWWFYDRILIEKIVVLDFGQSH